MPFFGAKKNANTHAPIETRGMTEKFCSFPFFLWIAAQIIPHQLPIAISNPNPESMIAITFILFSNVEVYRWSEGGAVTELILPIG